ncbi:MAG: glycosyltransferase family 4 protein [Carboxydocellales bacterium]
MKVAYFTPLNPKRSGISDYNEELIFYLKDYLDIHLFLDGYSPSNISVLNNFLIFDIKDFESQHARYNYQVCIYHVGNNQQYHEYLYRHALEYSGIIVMHDYALHHMLAGMLLENKSSDYLEEVYYNYGEAGLNLARKALSGVIPPLWETSAIDYPMNRRIIESSKGIIVHSAYVQDIISKTKPDIPTRVVTMHCADIVDNPIDEKIQARKRLGINSQEIILASFGLIVATKRIDIILRVIKKLSKYFSDFRYYLVGQEVEEFRIRDLVKELGLKDKVVFTGHIALDKFKDYMKASDVCLNLRYPDQGETSASLIRLMGMGKPVFVSNVGSFVEVPSDVVIKINVNETEENDLFDELVKYLNNPYLINEIGSKALDYVRNNCSFKKSALNYYEFIDEVVKSQGSLESLIGHKICTEISETLAEIGITREKDKFIYEVACLLDDIGMG